MLKTFIPLFVLNKQIGQKCRGEMFMLNAYGFEVRNCLLSEKEKTFIDLLSWKENWDLSEELVSYFKGFTWLEKMIIQQVMETDSLSVELMDYEWNELSYSFKLLFYIPKWARRDDEAEYDGIPTITLRRRFKLVISKILRNEELFPRES